MTKDTILKPPPKPCGTCPYRRDTPPGVWAEEEYRKLVRYDEETPFQPTGVFMCHQLDGCICGGWLMTHDRDHLLALRFHGHRMDPAVWDYAPKVEVFGSGAEAAAHGIAGIDNPSPAAVKKMEAIQRRREKVQSKGSKA